MRLIDKDLILKTAKDKEWGLWCEIVNIKFAPEVKAIPVEWLMKRADSDNIVQNALVRYLIELWEGEQNEH